MYFFVQCILRQENIDAEVNLIRFSDTLQRLVYNNHPAIFL